jgi:cbb3-type cytochrome oxidase subunit 3
MQRFHSESRNLVVPLLVMPTLPALFCFARPREKSNVVKPLISFSTQTQLFFLILLLLIYGYYMFRPTSGHSQAHSTKLKEGVKVEAARFFTCLDIVC